MNITYVLDASLQQAAFDIVLAVALLVAWRVPRLWWNSRRWRRERAERDAESLAVYRAREQKAFERRHNRRRRRAR